jgi:hypothetical protein
VKLELIQAQLAAAKSVLRHRQKLMNEATRAHNRVFVTVSKLEKRIANHLAKTK